MIPERSKARILYFKILGLLGRCASEIKAALGLDLVCKIMHCHVVQFKSGRTNVKVEPCSGLPTSSSSEKDISNANAIVNA